ncbi:hypothetical protein DSUL_60071 [Desulfovibrionales bacterium]
MPIVLPIVVKAINGTRSGDILEGKITERLGTL